MKKKESLVEYIITFILMVPFIIFEGYLCVLFFPKHPIGFSLIFLLIVYIAILYAKSQLTEQDNWFDKLCGFQLGVFISLCLLAFIYGTYKNLEKLFRDTSQIEVTDEELYDYCMKKHNDTERCRRIVFRRHLP